MSKEKGTGMPRILEKPDLEAVLAGRREVYCSCLFHGTHKCVLVALASHVRIGPFAVPVGTRYEPASSICSASCGAQFVTYATGEGPECGCTYST